MATEQIEREKSVPQKRPDLGDITADERTHIERFRALNEKDRRDVEEATEYFLSPKVEREAGSIPPVIERVLTAFGGAWENRCKKEVAEVLELFDEAIDGSTLSAEGEQFAAALMFAASEWDPQTWRETIEHARDFAEIEYRRAGEESDVA